MQEAWRLRRPTAAAAAQSAAPGKDALRRDRVQRDEGRVLQPRLGRVRVDVALPVPGYAVRARLGRRPGGDPGADPRGGARVSRPLLPSVELPDLPLWRHSPGGHPLVSPRELPLRVQGHRHRFRHPPAEALGCSPPPREVVPREEGYAPGRAVQRHHELAPAARHGSGGDRHARGAVGNPRGERRLAAAEGAGGLRPRRGPLAGERAGDRPEADDLRRRACAEPNRTARPASSGWSWTPSPVLPPAGWTRASCSP